MLIACHPVLVFFELPIICIFSRIALINLNLNIIHNYTLPMMTTMRRNILKFACLVLIQALMLISPGNGNSVKAATQWGNNTPPSSVITYPHTNAYYQAGSNMTIRVYSTDIGGTFPDGTVTQVDFIINDIVVHSTATHTQHTYTFVWTNIPQGTHRITARATDNLGGQFISAGVIVNVGTRPAINRGMSACKGKYLANIISHLPPRADFLHYWNGVTAENGSKWGTIEGTRDVMSWGQSDLSYNFARDNNLQFRYHAIIWGSQYPLWLRDIRTDVAAFRAEVLEYMDAVAARYDHIDQFCVINEQLRTHAPGTPMFRDGLGGNGVTGFDWQIWVFEQMRQRFPNSKLMLNDYGLENDPTAIEEKLALMEVLRDRGLIDGFGTQAHYFNVDQLWNAPGTLRTRLDMMDNAGVPIYVTELDLRGEPMSEANQLRSYQNLFPVFWEHPAVAGITLWGYVVGQTWREGLGIMNPDGTYRSAMTWLVNYMAGRPNTPGFPQCGNGLSPADDPANLLRNGDFERGTVWWDIQNTGATGTFSVVETPGMSGLLSLRICAPTFGTIFSAVRTRQTTPIVAGRSYEISFMARADAPRAMQVVVREPLTPWTFYSDRTVNLTTEWQTFTHTFTAAATSTTAMLQFYTGASATCVNIDRVVMRQVIPSSITDNRLNQRFSVFPNPVTDLLQVSSTQAWASCQYEVLNSLGQPVMRGTLEPGSQISMKNLPGGIYFIHLKCGDTVELHRVVKK